MLLECLQSLRKQGISEEAFEIIVVDNGSKDGSIQAVEEKFPQVKLIRNGSNQGFCRANNQGISIAEGEFVALINNDAVADPFWLQQLLTAFESSSRIGMAASKIIDFADPRRIDKCGHVIFPDGQNRGRGTGEIDRGQYDKVEEVLWPDGCAAMYRRSMLEQIGGFDEDLFAYADDAELGLRARIAGWRCVYNPRAVVRHRRGTTLGRGNPVRVQLIERNRILLALKLFPWSLLIWNPFYFALRMTGGLVSAMKSPGQGDLADFPGLGGKLRVMGAILTGQWSALLMMPRTLAKRKAVARMAKLRPDEIRRLILDNGVSPSALVGVNTDTGVAP